MLPVDVTKLNRLLLNDPVFSVPAYATSQARQLEQFVRGTPPPTATAVIAQINGLPGGEQTTYARLIKFVREFYPGVDEEVDGLVTYRGFGFRTNGAALVARVKDAWRQLGRLITACCDAVKLVKDPAIMAGYAYRKAAQSSQEAAAVALYKKWFDATLKTHRIETVRAVFTNLRLAVTTQQFELVCEGDPVDPDGLIYPNPIKLGEYGEVRPADNRNRFYVGPSYFKELNQHMGGTCSLSVAPATGRTYQQTKDAIVTALNASTISTLHELTHITAIWGTDDNNPTPYNVAACQTKAASNPDLAIDNAENYSLFAKDILTKMQFSPPQMKK